MTRAKGITIVEMLVVFVFAAMLSVLVIQGVGFFLAGYDRVAGANQDARNAVLQRTWFATTVRGMVASRHLERRFKGDPRAFECQTLEALSAESGLPVKVRWSLRDAEEGVALAYEEAANEVDWTVLTRAGPDAALAFEYADRAGNWQQEWPQSRFPRDFLPRAVRLVAEDGETVWLVRLDMHFLPIINDEDYS